MRPFAYVVPRSLEEALAAMGEHGDDSAWLAGGTNLLDLMKIGVAAPGTLVDVGGLPLAGVHDDGGSGLRIGALARLRDVADDPRVRTRVPMLAQSILAGASPQLRNMATVGGNLLQRTRCPYYRDLLSACNRRRPGSGCAALQGPHRTHAVLGTSEHCIAVHPSDMCVALAALDAAVDVAGPQGGRSLPMRDLHPLPGDHPEVESALEPGELVTAVRLSVPAYAGTSLYLKARDRASFAFALASAAVALDVDGDGTVRDARVALGGVGTRPWRSPEAEAALRGREAVDGVFREAAEAALEQARPRRDNAFKVELARRLLVRALRTVAGAARVGSPA